MQAQTLNSRLFRPLLGASLILIAGCSNSDTEPRSGMVSMSFGTYEMYFQFRNGQARRVVVLGCPIGRPRTGQRVVNGRFYYVLGNFAYYAPPGSLVLIHGLAEACVAVKNVSPEALTRFYRSVKEDYRDLATPLRRLAEQAGNEKAILLVEKMLSEGPVDASFRERCHIPKVQAVPLEPR